MIGPIRSIILNIGSIMPCTWSTLLILLTFFRVASPVRISHRLLRHRQLNEQLKTTVKATLAARSTPIDHLFFPHDKKGATYAFYYDGVSPAAFDLFASRNSHDKRPTYNWKEDVTQRIYTVTLAAAPLPPPPSTTDGYESEPEAGDIVALCTCDANGYLAAMNVLLRFGGDKLSSELAAQCYAWHRRLGVKHPSVTNVGGKGGALSYTRGAFTTGYRFWSQEGESGPYVSLPTTKDGDDIDRDELFREGKVPSAMYFSEAEAEKKGPKRKVVPNLEEGVGTSRHRTIEEIFAPLHEEEYSTKLDLD